MRKVGAPARRGHVQRIVPCIHQRRGRHRGARAVVKQPCRHLAVHAVTWCHAFSHPLPLAARCLHARMRTQRAPPHLRVARRFRRTAPLLALAIRHAPSRRISAIATAPAAIRAAAALLLARQHVALWVVERKGLLILRLQHSKRGARGRRQKVGTTSGLGISEAGARNGKCARGGAAKGLEEGEGVGGGGRGKGGQQGDKWGAAGEHGGLARLSRGK